MEIHKEVESMDDAIGTYRSSAGTDTTVSFSLKDLKVGDMPQANFAFGLTFTPLEGLTMQTVYKFYGRHYARRFHMLV